MNEVALQFSRALVATLLWKNFERNTKKVSLRFEVFRGERFITEKNVGVPELRILTGSEANGYLFDSGGARNVCAGKAG